MEVQPGSPIESIAARTRRPDKAPIYGVRVGVLRAVDTAGAHVAYPLDGREAGAPARSTVPLSADDIGREVLLAFESGHAGRPIVTGLLEPPATPGRVKAPPSGLIVDDRQISVNAERQLVLTCGKASITLQADGTVYIRGVRIVSRARAANKIKGATVAIN